MLPHIRPALGAGIKPGCRGDAPAGDAMEPVRASLQACDSHDQAEGCSGRRVRNERIVLWVQAEDWRGRKRVNPGCGSAAERGFAPLRTSPHQRLKAFGNLDLVLGRGGRFRAAQRSRHPHAAVRDTHGNRLSARRARCRLSAFQRAVALCKSLLGAGGGGLARQWRGRRIPGPGSVLGAVPERPFPGFGGLSRPAPNPGGPGCPCTLAGRGLESDCVFKWLSRVLWSGRRRAGHAAICACRRRWRPLRVCRRCAGAG